MEKNESRMNHRRGVDELPAVAGRGYCTVKIPAALAQAIDEYLREEEAEVRGFRSRADVVVGVLVDFLESRGTLKPLIKPRFEHVNVYESHVLVRDNLLNTSVEVRLSDSGPYCVYCLDGVCPHVGYALSLDDVRETLCRRGVVVRDDVAYGGGYVVVLDGVAYPLATE
ncbi:MAG: hypothetical protein NZ581_04180 [Candidatus Caldarchaeum sp.]|nr:hypothetical protein [Candidatus Caldarchaeum sp.]MDW8435379.1 hypothetical protein [Candidatus Caldarchaeum sp.]